MLTFKSKYKYIKEKSDEWLYEARCERYDCIYQIINYLDNDFSLTELKEIQKQLYYWHSFTFNK